MSSRNPIRTTAATLGAALAILAMPLAGAAQPAPPAVRAAMPTYARAYVRDPFPYARPVAVAHVRRHHHRRYGPGYGVAYGYPAYGSPYPVYGYPYPVYGYPGWYGPYASPFFSVGVGFRFGGCCYGGFHGGFRGRFR
jgi:hypothetical protein